MNETFGNLVLKELRLIMEHLAVIEGRIDGIGPGGERHRQIPAGRDSHSIFAQIEERMGAAR